MEEEPKLTVFFLFFPDQTKRRRTQQTSTSHLDPPYRLPDTPTHHPHSCNRLQPLLSVSSNSPNSSSSIPHSNSLLHPSNSPHNHNSPLPRWACSGTTDTRTGYRSAAAAAAAAAAASIAVSTGQQPPKKIRLQDNNKEAPGAYNPQVEAISPTLPEQLAPDDQAFRTTKDELIQQIGKVDREIAKAESQIAILKKKQAELEEIANKPAVKKSTRTTARRPRTRTRS
nr:unnamed protein product [Callosobruchus analis]